MPTNSTLLNKHSLDTSGLTGKASELASQMKEKVSDLGRTAVDKIDNNRGSAASGLESAASTLRQKADNLPGGEKVTSFANTTADKLNSTAQYVRGHPVSRMMSDLEQVVKKNPGPSLIAATLIGYLAGRAFSRD